jgi:hypothetical protein
MFSGLELFDNEPQKISKLKFMTSAAYFIVNRGIVKNKTVEQVHTLFSSWSQSYDHRRCSTLFFPVER